MRRPQKMAYRHKYSKNYAGKKDKRKIERERRRGSHGRDWTGQVGKKEGETVMTPASRRWVKEWMKSVALHPGACQSKNCSADVKLSCICNVAAWTYRKSAHALSHSNPCKRPSQPLEPVLRRFQFFDFIGGLLGSWRLRGCRHAI